MISRLMSILLLFFFINCLKCQSIIIPKDSDALYGETPVVDDPKIYYLSAVANISNRFCTTLITCRVKNPSVVAKEATFSITIPEKAFISGFVMEINNKSYKAFVEEKKAAQKIYDTAVDRGQGAAQVKTNTRDSKRFSVNVNLEPEEKAVFYLTYEEFLVRKLGKYEVVLNIHPGQPVQNLHMQVLIYENQPVKLIQSPIIRRSTNLNDKQLETNAKFETTATLATIKFFPDVYEQRRIARSLETGEKYGLSGQFVVQYDVDRNSTGGEIIQSKGHFAHFFVPKSVPVYPKYVVFVLDTSFSMYGTKIEQLKTAMINILSGLNPQDKFNIIEFNGIAKVWDVDEGAVTYTEGTVDDFNEAIDNPTLPAAHEATKENIDAAKAIINLLEEFGGTDIHSALLVGYKVLQHNMKALKETQPIIIFLTDGDTTVGQLDYQVIIDEVTKLNGKMAPLFTLSLGDEPNRYFLEEISLNNDGQTKHIYEDNDISLQLENFFKELSSPLLKNVTFKLGNGVDDVTKTDFTAAYKDSEIVVVGRKKDDTDLSKNNITIEALSTGGKVVLKPSIETATTDMNRLWAYSKVRQLLEQRKIAKKKEKLTKRALDLALKYSFVTEVTSLVVVKPQDKSIVDSEDASGDSKEMVPTTPRVPLRPHDMGGIFVTAPATSSPPFTEGPSSPPFTEAASLPPFPEEIKPNKQQEPGNIDGLITDVFGSVPGGQHTTPKVDVIHSNEFKPISPVGPELEVVIKLKQKMPWLDDILADNGTLTTNSGKLIYLHLASKTGQQCTGTRTGTCKAVKDCERLFFKLSNLPTFLTYVCPLDTVYSGICC